jgi:uncharacterized protein YgiM (DUF1202 family)
MKNIIAIAAILILGNVAWCQTNPNHVRVQGHTKNDGTYVPTHMRTAPNSTNRDNFSTKPNTNPYTGQAGWITPDNKTFPTYGGSTYEPSTIYPSTTYSPNTYSNYPTNNSVNPTESSSLYPYSNNGFSKTSFYDSYPTYETKNKSNLREQMSTSSAIIETLPQGAFVKVISSFFGEWWEVYANGHKGYIHSSLLNFVSAGEKREILNTNRLLTSSYTKTSGSPNAQKVEPNKVYKTNKIISLRATPNPRSIEFKLVGMYEKIRVIEFRDDWVKIEYSNESGWVEKSVISVQ